VSNSQDENLEFFTTELNDHTQPVLLE